MGNGLVNFVVKKRLLKKRIFLKISRKSKVIDKCRLPKNTPANMFIGISVAFPCLWTKALEEIFKLQ